MFEIHDRKREVRNGQKYTERERERSLQQSLREAERRRGERSSLHPLDSLPKTWRRNLGS